MLFFLRELNKALETEKDRINQRKVNGDEISPYEVLLNYDFENTDINSCITFDDINEELVLYSACSDLLKSTFCSVEIHSFNSFREQ